MIRDPNAQRANGPRTLTTAQRELLRRTVGAPLKAEEFEQLIAIAERTGLDPLRRQLSAVVRDPDRAGRSVLFITTIDGLRSLAAAEGDYRPAETAPRLTFDRRRRDPTGNPSGLVRAEVTLWKKSGRRWHAVSGEAWWEEFAPAAVPRREGEDGASHGGRLPEAWAKMGRLMLTKCAEAQALRRGWPERRSELYAEDEGDRARHEAKAQKGGRTPDRRAGVGVMPPAGATDDAPLGGAALWLRLNGDPERVSLRRFLVRVEDHLGQVEKAPDVQAFITANRETCARETWAALWLRDESLAYAVKGAIEARLAALGGPPAGARRSARQQAPRKASQRRSATVDADHEAAS